MLETATLRVVWENSYIYPYTGESPLYWYAQVEYHNLGSQPEPVICPGATNPSLAKVQIRGTEGLPPGVTDYITAEETFCSRNPNFIDSLEPGGTFYYWVIFRNVPSGGEVSLELDHDPYTVSEWVDPWYSPFDAPPPAECPAELVSLGICQPSNNGEPQDVGGLATYTCDTVSCPGADNRVDLEISGGEAVSCTWHCATFENVPNRFVVIDFFRFSGGCWEPSSTAVSDGIC